MSDTRRPGRTSLAGRLLTAYAVVFVVLIGLFGLVARNGMVTVLRDQTQDRLASEAAVLGLDLRGVGAGDLQTAVDLRAPVLDARITVVDLDGVVLADSAFDPAGMENHGDRPEVLEALAGDVGRGSRVSSTTGERRTYVAAPPVDGRVYRLSVTEEQLGRLATDVSTRIGIAALIAGVIGVALVALVARRLARPIEQLTDVAAEMAGGRLDATARRSSVVELDRLGQAVGRMSTQLGRRIRDVESEAETLQALLDALPQGVMLVGSDEVVLFGNRTAAALLGSIPDDVGRITPVAYAQLVRDTIETGEPHEVEVDYGGAGPTIRALATPLPADRVLLVLTDVTEHRRVEAMRRDFVADASHELKTPVATILASSETMRMAMDSDDPDQAARFLATIEDSARHLARVVGDLLDLSRLESSDPGAGLVRVDEVVAEEMAGLRARAEAAGVHLEADLRATTVTGSGSDIGLAVRNLVDNAIRFSVPGDRVSVAMSVDGPDLVISVVDTGAGIPQRSLGRVFERFYRVDVARSRETGGTGLGLAIVKHVAESHGGSVSVESALGSGSTFRVRLPVSDA